MIRLMFVCHGNICRSPMAEVIMKHLVEKEGLSSHFFIASSATSSEEIGKTYGNPVHPEAKDELARHGLSAGNKRAVQLTKEDYQKYDIFIGMDFYNIRNMNRLFKDDPEGKITRLLEHAGRRADVSDPWYTGEFDVTYRDIEEGCIALLEKLKKGIEEGKELAHYHLLG
jgi:protein-tyrosine phosphatase